MSGEVNATIDLYDHDALVAVADEFWSMVDIVPGDGDECWEWTGSVDKNGYGKWGGSLAHRRALEMNVGPLGAACVLHACDNPPCCRPSHLSAGTRADNVADMISRGRARHLGLAGERSPSSKLTVTQVAEIRQRYEQGGISQMDLGAMFGVSQTQISNIIRRRHWTSEECA